MLGAIAVTAYLALRRRGFFHAFHEKVGPFLRALRLFAHVEGVLLAGLTVVAWCGEGLTLLLIGSSLGLDLHILDTLQIIVLASLFAAIPAAPGYAGTFDAGLVLGLKAVGVTGGDRRRLRRARALRDVRPGHARRAVPAAAHVRRLPPRAGRLRGSRRCAGLRGGRPTSRRRRAPTMIAAGISSRSAPPIASRRGRSTTAYARRSASAYSCSARPGAARLNTLSPMRRWRA